MKNLYRVKIKYVENKEMDVISYSHEMKLLECKFNETPLLAVGESEEEVGRNVFEFIKDKYVGNSTLQQMLRKDSIMVTIVNVYDEEIGGVRFSHGVNGTSTFSWDKLLTEFV